MLIHCTKKLLDELNVIPCERQEEDALFSWHANLITVNRKKAVILMNDKNNYVIVIFGLKAKDFKILGEHILNAVRHSFREEFIKDEVINIFINKSNVITYSKTSSRSIISKLNNVCLMLPHFEDLLDETSIYQSSLSIKFSQMPVKGGTQKYIFPYEELYKDLEAFVDGSIFTHDGVIDKVIDFIISIAKLYGMVQKDKVVEIYNMQNEDKIDEATINFHMKKGLDILNDNFVKVYRDYFVFEPIMEVDLFEK